MKSRELSKILRNVADYLDGRPEFKGVGHAFLSDYDKRLDLEFDDKNGFVEAAKSMGDSKKEYTDGEYGKLVLRFKNAPLDIKISRDKVCKKIVTFDCEPLFSKEELEVL